MLQIVITILKILGIVLLVILAILAVLLLLLLAALASPIRYHFMGGYHGALQFTGRITWLFRLSGVSVKYMDHKMDIQISVFGHILGNGSKKSSRRRKKKKKEKSDDSETIFSAAETEVFSVNPEEAGVLPEDSTVLPDEEPDEQVLSDEDLDEQVLSDEDLGEQVLSDKDLVGQVLSDEEPGEQVLPDEELYEQMSADAASATESEEKNPQSAEIRKEKSDIAETAAKVIHFLQMPSVKQLIGRLFKSLKKIIRHLLPDILRVRGTVGFADPAQTGRVMEAAAVLYAFYPDQVQITPSFDEEVLEGEVELKGKIVLLYLLIKGIGMALCVFLNKECRGFFQEMKRQMSA